MKKCVCAHLVSYRLSNEEERMFNYQMIALEATILVVCAYLIIFQNLVHASPLLAVDDAGIKESGSCTLESSVHLFRHNTQVYTLQPFCGLGSNLELSLGVNEHVQAHNRQEENLSLQLKRSIQTIEKDGWGLAASFAMNRNLKGDLDSNWIINIPASFALYDDRLTLNTNVLYQHEHKSKDILGGVSAVYALNPRSSFIVELYRADDHAAFYQSIYAFQLVPRLVLEMAYGNRFRTSQDQWFGLGLNFNP